MPPRAKNANVGSQARETPETRRRLRSASRELSDTEQAPGPRQARGKGESNRQAQTAELDTVPEDDSPPPPARRRSFNSARGVAALRDREKRSAVPPPPTTQPEVPTSAQPEAPIEISSNEDIDTDSSELPGQLAEKVSISQDTTLTPSERPKGAPVTGAGVQEGTPTPMPSTTQMDVPSPARPSIAEDLQSTIPAVDPQEDPDTAVNQPGPSTAPSSSAASVFARFIKASAESNKENTPQSRKRSFIDRQVGAERITFDDADGSNPQLSRARKRAKKSQTLFVEEDSNDPVGDDDDDDDGFEVDQRPATSSATRREQVRKLQTKSQALKHLRQGQATVESVEAGPSHPRQSRTTSSVEPAHTLETRYSLSPPPQIAPKRRARTSRESVPPKSHSPLPLKPPKPPGPNDEIDYEAVNRAAKEFTAQLNAVKKVDQPQQRRRWTNEETAVLTNMIARFGCKWAEITRQNHPALQGRDQGALKDKARNMKVDYLKANISLPLNFDMVPINESQRRKLRELGINA